jgi:hypothetical protein
MVRTAVPSTLPSSGSRSRRKSRCRIDGEARTDGTGMRRQETMAAMINLGQFIAGNYN